MIAHQQVRRSLVGFALSMVIGLFFECILQRPALPLLALSAVWLAWLLARPARSTSLGVYVAILLLSAAYGAIESIPTPAGSSLLLAEVLAKNQSIQATICSDPVCDISSAVTRCQCAVNAVEFEEGWRRSAGLIRVRIRGLSQLPSYGERWLLRGQFRSDASIRGRLQGTFYATASRSVCIGSPPRSLRGFCYRMRRRAAQVLGRGLEDFPAAEHLLQALLLGYRHELSRDNHLLFARTGTLHIFAISGLHVGVLATIAIAILKMMGVSKPRWGLYLIPILLIYVISTGMKPSAFRAFVMAASYLIAPLFHRRPDTGSAIALAALILLGVDPLQLRDPGFLLSFTVVCGIVAVHGFAIRRRHRRRLVGRASWFPEHGPHFLVAGVRATKLLLLTSGAAWLFSIPLTAHFFNTLSRVAPIGNWVLIPLTFLIVLSGCLSLISAPVSLSVSLIFNHANRIFIAGLLAIVEWLNRIPGACCWVRSPSPAVLFGWYGGLLLFFMGSWPRRKLALLFFFCAVSLWASECLSPRASPGIELRRAANLATLVIENSAPVALSVGGSSYSLFRATRLLRENGIQELPWLVISGPSIDVGALQTLCERVAVGHVGLPQSARESISNTPLVGWDLHFAENLAVPLADGELAWALR